MEEPQIVELHFSLRGETLPADHAYWLYAAVSQALPETHNADWLGIHTIKGRKLGNGLIKLGRFARLRMRLSFTRVPSVWGLAGAKLNVGGHLIQCGIPEIRPLKAAKTLRSRFVMIKCKGSEGRSAEVTSFLDSLVRQLESLGVSADVVLERGGVARGEDGFACRRVMSVKDAKLTGYGVILDNLNEHDSLTIQEVGLGGKRRMGCGLFEPIGRGD